MFEFCLLFQSNMRSKFTRGTLKIFSTKLARIAKQSR